MDEECFAKESIHHPPIESEKEKRKIVFFLRNAAANSQGRASYRYFVLTSGVVVQVSYRRQAPVFRHGNVLSSSGLVIARCDIAYLFCLRHCPNVVTVKSADGESKRSPAARKGFSE